MTSKQTLINSGFDGTTTAMQALAGKDLHGMTAIVNGQHHCPVVGAHQRGNN